jgi:NADPH-dependent 2,4-dienoyl-CoA reductase/sulfur reductase-like enzyme
VLLKIAQDNGIHYQSNTTIKGSSVSSEDGQIRNIVLSNKSSIPSDLVILGIGVQPVTNFVGDLTIDSKVFLDINIE